MEHICKHCWKLFYRRSHWNKEAKFCCYLCFKNSKTLRRPNNSPIKICQICGKEYKIKQCRAENSRVCSKKCYYKIQKLSSSHMKWKHHSEDTKKRISIKKIWTIVSEETKRKLSKANLGKKMSVESKKKMSKASKWAGNSQRKGWVTLRNDRGKIRIELCWWSREIFKRDNWTCKFCEKEWWLIHAHHIKKFIDYPELRLDINNWITLCKRCHDILLRREEQFEELCYSLI